MHKKSKMVKIPGIRSRCSYLDSAARDEYVLLIDVEVDVRDGGQVGRAPLIKVGDELEGEVRQLVAVGG